MKDYTLWSCGVTCGLAIHCLFFGECVLTSIVALIAVLHFVCWRTFKW